ncbi:hypothetical protein JCM10449v2_003266 [Rhodotorula kratochvilovae]
MDAVLSRDLADLDLAYRDALRSGQIGDLPNRCSTLFARARQAIDDGQLQPSTVSNFRRVALRIKIISQDLVALDAGCHDVQQDVQHRAQAVLAAWQQRNVDPSRCTTPQPPDPREDDPAAFAPYRRWFVAHFANPYPSPKDKEALLAQVPRHNKTQLDTWFVNTRRRSGWQALKRAHTNGSVEDMVRLLRDVDEGAPAVDDDVRRKVERIRAFFDEGARDKVSDEIQAIVRHGVLAPPLAPAERARRRLDHRASRGVGGESASAAGGEGEQRGGSASSRPRGELSAGRPRRARTPPLLAAASGAYPDSPGEMSPLAAVDDAPRYPSTFSSPASSTARTVSDSSSASFDSLVSYASVESAYYDAPVASSPPATSSLLSFAGSLPSSSSAPLPPPPPPSFRPRAGRAAPYPSLSSRPHPYFCTVHELPTSSTLAGFATR